MLQSNLILNTRVTNSDFQERQNVRSYFAYAAIVESSKYLGVMIDIYFYHIQWLGSFVIFSKLDENILVNLIALTECNIH